jgi:hypothetical protein
MKKNIIFLAILIVFTSCSKITTEEFKNSLLGKSYIVINQSNDSIQVEFFENYVVTYSWDFRTFEEWEVTEKKNSIYFYFDGNTFEIKQVTDDGYIFSNNETEFELKKHEQEAFNQELIKGKWIDKRDFQILEDTTYFSHIPCPTGELMQLPYFEFTSDSCIIQDFCEKTREIYYINSKFGIIRFGENCLSIEQFRIKKLTKDTMIIDRRYREMSEIKYEKDKILTKYID